MRRTSCRECNIDAMNCVWNYYDEPDADGRRRVCCIHCGYVSRTRTLHTLGRIHGDGCTNLSAPRPGRELTNIIQMLEVEPTDKCNCVAKAAEMDRLGPDGCRAERSKLVEWLADAYKGLNYGQVKKAMVAAVKSGLAFSIVPWDVCGSLIDEAIRRSERAAVV
jgi:hypothetical protein